jgi:hypothetical protein
LQILFFKKIVIHVQSWKTMRSIFVYFASQLLKGVRGMRTLEPMKQWSASFASLSPYWALRA